MQEPIKASVKADPYGSPRYVPPDVQRVAAEICREYMRAADIHPRFASPHEGLAVIMEEFEELKGEVWKSPRRRNLGAMRREAIQLGAMALRFAYELLSDEEGRAYVDPTDNDPDGDHACEDLKRRAAAETEDDELDEVPEPAQIARVLPADYNAFGGD